MDDTGAPVLLFLFCAVMPKVLCRVLFNTGAGTRTECLGADVGP
jgi:hypothetical protein